MPRRLEPLPGCPDREWLNPSYGGALARPALARHFSWWRGGDSSFGSQIASGEDVAVVEQSSSALRQEDDVGEDASEPFLGFGDGAASWVDIEEEPETMNTDEILEGGGGSVFWSTLQVPTDAIIVTLDRFQSITGVSWWLTIIGSTAAVHVALFPLTVAQLQKASLLACLGSQLPPPVPPPATLPPAAVAAPPWTEI